MNNHYVTSSSVVKKEMESVLGLFTNLFDEVVVTGKKHAYVLLAVSR